MASRGFESRALPLPVSPQELVIPKLEDWLVRTLQQSTESLIEKRDIQQYGPNALRKAKPLAAALSVLVDLERVRVIADGTRIDVNPHLLEDDR